jgi:RNA polymerase III subunit RPC82 helix-turn-helix domain
VCLQTKLEYFDFRLTTHGRCSHCTSLCSDNTFALRPSDSCEPSTLSYRFLLFNEAYQSIASVLLTRGRLPLVQLVRITSLKSRLVRASILVLIQHNLLWHAHTEDDGEVFEVNVEECLMRMRLGKFVLKAEELFGPTVNSYHIWKASG